MYLILTMRIFHDAEVFENLTLAAIIDVHLRWLNISFAIP